MMKTKNTKIMKYAIMQIVIMVAAFASGCGKEVVSEPTNTPEPTETPGPTNAPEPENTPDNPTATPYPSGDTWDVSEEVPLEDWQIKVVMNDLEQFWGVWQRFDGALDCDAVISLVSQLPITQEAFTNGCNDLFESGAFILGPKFDWLVVTDSSTWPSYKSETWPGGVALELDTEYEWETFEIDPTTGERRQTLYGEHALFYAYLVYEEGMWRVYSLNKEVVEASN